MLALTHGTRRDVLAHFFVYAAVVLFFKGRDAVRRAPVLIGQARSDAPSIQAFGPWWLRAARLLVGYDAWSRTERFGILGISVVLCILFGWNDGGPFAAALFLAIAVVNGMLALLAFAAHASRPRV